jgi:hypothetical protein
MNTLLKIKLNLTAMELYKMLSSKKEVKVLSKKYLLVMVFKLKKRELECIV